MPHLAPPSAFTLVRRHFADPEIRDTPQLTVHAGEEGEPVRLTAAEAHEALYGPEPVPRLVSAIWRAALADARAERTPHGHQRLLLIWLALPQLTGTAYRICGRLNADRSDVEAEMVLALLTGLSVDDGEPPLSAEELLKRARASGWCLARASLRETPSAWWENRAEQATMESGTTDQPEAAPERPYAVEIEVERPDGPEGLRAALRFRVQAEQLRHANLVHRSGGSGRRGGDHRTGPSGRRRVGSLSLRREVRQR